MSLLEVGWVNTLAAVAHCGAIIIIVVAMLTLTPKFATAEFVFTKYFNDSGFESQSYVLMTGMTSALFCFVGYEASVLIYFFAVGVSRSNTYLFLYAEFKGGLL